MPTLRVEITGTLDEIRVKTYQIANAIHCSETSGEGWRLTEETEGTPEAPSPDDEGVSFREVL